MTAPGQLSLAELGARLFAPTEPCHGCGAVGEWRAAEGGAWVCGACHAGCPLAGCNPPAGLGVEEVQLWHLGKAAQAGDVAAAIAFAERLRAYEAPAVQGAGQA